MCDETHDPDEFKDLDLHMFDKYCFVVETGKPAFPPPGRPWWRRIIDEYW